jgi:hypothetical protein
MWKEHKELEKTRQDTTTRVRFISHTGDLVGEYRDVQKALGPWGVADTMKLNQNASLMEVKYIYRGSTYKIMYNLWGKSKPKFPIYEAEQLIPPSPKQMIIPTDSIDTAFLYIPHKHVLKDVTRKVRRWAGPKENFYWDTSFPQFGFWMVWKQWFYFKSLGESTSMQLIIKDIMGELYCYDLTDEHEIVWPAQARMYKKLPDGLERDHAFMKQINDS